MSLVESYHAAHKARLARMGAPSPVVAKPIIPQAIDAGWEDMWFFDLVTGHRRDPKSVRIRDIQEAVCRHYDVSILDLLSDRRTKEVARARLVAYYLSKNLTTRSLPEIGRRFGGRDHTTVLSGIRRIEGLCSVDTRLAADIGTIVSSIARAA